MIGAALFTMLGGAVGVWFFQGDTSPAAPRDRAFMLRSTQSGGGMYASMPTGEWYRVKAISELTCAPESDIVLQYRLQDDRWDVVGCTRVLRGEGPCLLPPWTCGWTKAWHASVPASEVERMTWRRAP
jgi:hypothetical protein